MSRKVVIEMSDELYEFLVMDFHIDDICSIIKELIDEGAIELGLTLAGFGDDLKVMEVTEE